MVLQSQPTNEDWLQQEKHFAYSMMRKYQGIFRKLLGAWNIRYTIKNGIYKLHLPWRMWTADPLEGPIAEVALQLVDDVFSRDRLSVYLEQMIQN